MTGLVRIGRLPAVGLLVSMLACGGPIEMTDHSPAQRPEGSGGAGAGDSGGSSGGNTGRPDPGPGAGGSPSMPDAPGSGGAGGAPTKNAWATLTLLAEGRMPAIGVTVFWSAPDGALLASAPTGVDGVSRALVPPGSMVTIVSELGEGESFAVTRLHTIVGIQPGDRIGPLAGFGPPAQRGVMQHLVWPDAVPGASRYAVQTGCGRYTVSSDISRLGSVDIAPDCLVSGQFHVFAEALDNQEHLVAGLIHLANVASEPIVLPPWRTTFDEVTVALANAPREGSVRLGASLVKEGVWFYPRSGLKADLMASLEPLVLRFPEGLQADGLSVRVRHSRAGVPGERGASVYVDGMPSRVWLDMASRLPTVTTEPVVLEAGRVAFHWAAQGDATAADYQELFLASGVSSRQTVVWEMLMEAGTSTIRVPVLPDALSQLQPTGMYALQAAQVIYVDLLGLDNAWDDIRQERTRPEDRANTSWSVGWFATADDSPADVAISRLAGSTGKGATAPAF